MAGVLTATDLPLLVGADASVFSDVCTEMTVWFRNRITDITFLAEWNDGSPEANLS